jgi:predicted Zn-dependent protease
MKRYASIAVLCGWLLVSMAATQAKSSHLQTGQLQTETLPTKVAYAPRNIFAFTPRDTTPSTDDYLGKQSKMYRWSDQTHFVMVYIQQAPNLPAWRAENIPVVRAAFSEWQAALSNRILFVFTPNPNQADVTVSWWDTPPSDVEPGACGSQQVAFWDKYMARNNIALSLHDANNAAWPADKLYSFALHEIGHMMGISEHSDNPDDIMAPVIYMQRHLSARDTATIRRLYATKTPYTNPPGYHLARFQDFQRLQEAHLTSNRPWFPVLSFLPHYR